MDTRNFCKMETLYGMPIIDFIKMSILDGTETEDGMIIIIDGMVIFFHLKYVKLRVTDNKHNYQQVNIIMSTLDQITITMNGIVIMK